MNTLIVGQEVCVVTCGNQVRHRDPVVSDGVITKVGRKYFTVKVNPNGKYPVEVVFDLFYLTEKTEYSPDWAFYHSRQAYDDHKEVQDIREEVRKLTGNFVGTGIFKVENIDTLRKIQALIKELK